MKSRKGKKVPKIRRRVSLHVEQMEQVERAAAAQYRTFSEQITFYVAAGIRASGDQYA